MPSPSASSSILISENNNGSKNGVKSSRSFKPLSVVFWVASVACVSFLLHGFDYFKINSLTPAPQPFVYNLSPPPSAPSTANINTNINMNMNMNMNIGVTTEMLDRVHARHFYPANSTSIARIDTGVHVDDMNVGSLNAVRGQVYNHAAYAKKSGYLDIKRSAMDKFRRASPIHKPRGCAYNYPNAYLGEFRNVWVDGSGDIYIPVGNSSSTSGTVDVMHYSYQGGCCAHDWKILVRRRPISVNRRCHHKLAFAIVQHHGSTFSHLMDEGVPRLFSFWKVAYGVLKRGGVIAVSKFPLFPSILHEYFGVNPRQIAQVSLTEPCFFERVILPEAYQQGYYPRTCVKAATENVLRSLFLESEPLPVVLLIERAYRRLPGGKCYGRRCLSNFHELRNAIINEFGKRVIVETVGPSTKGGIRNTARLFNRATVVVGVHGAGFANLMYMRQWGTHIIHLGWSGMWQFYARKADAHNIQFVNVLSPGASQNGDNVKAEIPVILLEIRRALTKEGYTLDKPIWRIDPRKSKDVVMRLPQNLRSRT